MKQYCFGLNKSIKENAFTTLYRNYTKTDHKYLVFNKVVLNQFECIKTISRVFERMYFQ